MSCNIPVIVLTLYLKILLLQVRHNGPLSSFTVSKRIVSGRKHFIYLFNYLPNSFIHLITYVVLFVDPPVSDLLRIECPVSLPILP